MKKIVVEDLRPVGVEPEFLETDVLFAKTEGEREYPVRVWIAGEPGDGDLKRAIR